MRRVAQAVSAVGVALSTLALVLWTTDVDAAPPLQRLASHVGAGQGVYAVAADGTVLVAQAETQAVHPASVTKIATTLALLERLGPTYRFTTRIVATGPLHGDRLEGDLVFAGGGDPFVVDESVLLVRSALWTRGLRTVCGRVVARGSLLLDWQPDGDGRRIEAVLRRSGGDEARARLAAVGRDAGAALRFDHQHCARGAGSVLAVYRSPPLLHVVKVLNGYSNNVFHFAAGAIGGVAAVEAAARAHVPEPMRDEIVIANGAGAGTMNRMSPRAAVALLAALADVLARDGRDLTSALPVSGIDPGTLAERLPEQRGMIVGKTGTFGSVGASALVGALRTRRWGVVRFAMLHHGVAVPEARARQDAFARALIAATDAEPWAYGMPTRPAYLDAELE